MTPRRNLLDESVRAYRYETGAPGDGRATRARVLADAQGRVRRGGGRRRAVLAAAAATVVALSGAGAYTALGRWRAAASARPPHSVAARVAVTTPSGVLPPLAPAPAIAPPLVAAPAPVLSPARDGTLEEQRDYGRAHALHFGGGDARQALAAWNAYLKRYPRGALVPEARYNRALTLLRLGHDDAAVQALRPFTEGAFGSYRRDEAELLIKAVVDRRR